MMVARSAAGKRRQSHLSAMWKGDINALKMHSMRIITADVEVIHHLPYADWIAAQRELKAIHQRARMTGVLGISFMLAGIWRSLVVNRQPHVAACELEYVADLVSRYPHLRQSMQGLANRICEYPGVQGHSLSSGKDKMN